MELADADRITAHVHGDRLEMLWLLTPAGLRRSEIAGLRWSDFDLDAGTFKVRRGRVNLGAKHAEPTDPTAPHGIR